MRSRMRLSPLTKMFSMLSMNRSISFLSLSLPSASVNMSAMPDLRLIHSSPCLLRLSISCGSELLPIVLTSLYLPLSFLTTTTLVEPDLFFFCWTNITCNLFAKILKKSIGTPISGASTKVFCSLQANYNFKVFFVTKSGGLYTQGKQNLYVNIGLGETVLRPRIGAKPEITVLTLKRK